MNMKGLDKAQQTYDDASPEDYEPKGKAITPKKERTIVNPFFKGVPSDCACDGCVNKRAANIHIQELNDEIFEASKEWLSEGEGIEMLGLLLARKEIEINELSKRITLDEETRLRAEVLKAQERVRRMDDDQSVIFGLIREEREAQDKKWGTANEFSRERGMAILGEEFGESCTEVLEGNDDLLRKELIQVAAVCVKCIERWDLLVVDAEYEDVKNGEPA